MKQTDLKPAGRNQVDMSHINKSRLHKGVAGLAKLGALAWCLPLLASAAARDDYARQWPLQLPAAQEGAYRVTLDGSVYEQTRSPQLADLDILDASGKPVPSLRAAPASPGIGPAQRQDLPWFPLPASPQARDVASISEIAADGSLRRVQWSAAEVQANAPAAGFLIDASALKQPLQALQLQWQVDSALERDVRLEASDDLRQWRPAEGGDARLIDLRNNGARVLRNRVEFAPQRARYWRLLVPAPLPADFRLLSVQAETATPGVATAWQWQNLSAKRTPDAKGQMHYEFELPGRYPIARADVDLPGNNTQQWRLEARDRDDAPWQHVAGPWVAFRVASAGSDSASPPQDLAGLHRDRYWRLTAVDGVDAALPTLRLGWQAESLVFVSQGQPPFVLVAGSARASRAAASVQPTLDAIRQQRGADWQPSVATLGAPQALAGDAALTPAPKPRDWKTWLLWSLLVVGALLVTGLALSLMRNKPASE